MERNLVSVEYLYGCLFCMFLLCFHHYTLAIGVFSVVCTIELNSVEHRELVTKRGFRKAFVLLGLSELGASYLLYSLLVKDYGVKITGDTWLDFAFVAGFWTGLLIGTTLKLVQIRRREMRR